jgi:aldose 1-epimerase
MSQQANPASGEQIEIVHAGQRAVVTGLGATLRLFQIEGRDVVDGFAEDEMSPASHGHILAPWPNRIAGGHYRDPDGVEQQLPLTEPARANALHGLANWLPWTVTTRTRIAAGLDCELFPTPGYPFHLLLRALYALSDAGLECSVTATNVGARAAPYGIGHHPYLACPGGSADQAWLRIPAARVLETDARMIPTGVARDVAGTPLDFRVARQLGDTALDHCFTDLQPDPDGIIRATLGDGEEWRTTLWMRPPFRNLMVYTSDTLEAPRRRRAIAIEPMTCPPNAFQTGVDLILLAPGESVQTSWGIAAKR